MNWVLDLNNETPQLVVVTKGKKTCSLHQEAPMDQEVFVSLIIAVKMKCIDKGNLD